MNPAYERAVTVAGSSGSAGVGLLALVADVPGSTWLAFMGILGAVLAPIVVQVLRWAEGRTALVDQLDRLQDQVSRNRITLLELGFVADRSTSNVDDLEAACAALEKSGGPLPLVQALRNVQKRSRENALVIRRLEGGRDEVRP